jgi:beta-lactamase class A
MQDLSRRLDELCDSLPFHTSWFLKDWRTGATADRLGHVAVPSASTRKISIMMAALAAVHAGKLSLDQKVTVEAPSIIKSSSTRSTRKTTRGRSSTSRRGSGSPSATRW